MQDGNNTPGNQTPAQKTVNELKVFQETTVTLVQTQIQELVDAGSLVLPKEYAIGNQMKLAWLNLLEVTDKDGKRAIDVCSKESVCNAFLKMAVQGLSVAKNQGYFVVRGKTLSFEREYHGTVALARRIGGVVDVPTARVIYEGDVFEYEINPETAKIRVIKHEQKFENININKIKGAYCSIPLKDEFRIELMTMEQIRAAWNQGPMKGQSPAHKNFTDQMCIKTVISRGCKLLITTSDDAGLIGDDETSELTPITDGAPEPGAGKGQAKDERRTINTGKTPGKNANATDATIIQEQVDPNAGKESAFESAINNAAGDQAPTDLSQEEPQY